MRDLNVSLLQCPLHWEAPAANRAYVEEMISQLSADTDLLILPEMFTTGFSMRSKENAETSAGATLPWLQQLAERYDLAITGSLAVASDDQVYNRLLFVTPDGRVQHYDKKHLFRMSGEHLHYAAGDSRLVVQWRDWRICPMICYDLRFPVWSRNTGDYDLLLYVANWPAKRQYHWRQLLIARAIENQAYCIGVNRIGTDGNAIAYSGDSLILAADGEMLVDCADAEGLFSSRLSASALQRYRSKFPCHEDADNFSL
ncbi:amidohydrolase [Halieaceae bacterium IMCC14734]|uniref:Amidohydrolase n=1 Tax=Candidatus Litorirhabdus singularis TaxID=2518993 RepID=A0ABT3TNM5_9GAMM|nr:amidohydrolase [Candidatus Litorirhabdus singularis]MCX2982979.1 amidohydrolase [Candidatus Litorirhabdus singularis]